MNANEALGEKLYYATKKGFMEWVKQERGLTFKVPPDIITQLGVDEVNSLMDKFNETH